MRALAATRTQQLRTAGMAGITNTSFASFGATHSARIATVSSVPPRATAWTREAFEAPKQQQLRPAYRPPTPFAVASAQTPCAGLQRIDDLRLTSVELNSPRYLSYRQQPDFHARASQGRPAAWRDTYGGDAIKGAMVWDSRPWPSAPPPTMRPRTHHSTLRGFASRSPREH